jgi:hypothetical protein
MNVFFSQLYIKLSLVFMVLKKLDYSTELFNDRQSFEISDLFTFDFESEKKDLIKDDGKHYYLF